MTNFIPEICETLGLEIGEKFKVDLSRWSDIYYFNNNGLIGKTYTDHWIPCPELFVMIVAGNAKIIKLPWEPKDDDMIWTFRIDDKNNNAWTIEWGTWENSIDNIAKLKMGWVYRTEDEAKAALPEIAEKFGANYVL